MKKGCRAGISGAGSDPLGGSGQHDFYAAGNPDQNTFTRVEISGTAATEVTSWEASLVASGGMSETTTSTFLQRMVLVRCCSFQRL